MAGPGGFDPNAAISGTGTGSAFNNLGTPSSQQNQGNFNIYAYSNQTGDIPTNDGQGSVGAAEYGGKAHVVTVSAADYADNYLNSIADNPAAIRSLQQQLSNAGYSVSVTGLLDSATLQSYMALLQDVSVANGAGTIITPDQYLQQRITGGGGSNGTQSAVSLSGPMDARSAALSAFQQELGRKPTQKQMDAFYAALHSYEAANPSVTSRTGAGNNYTQTTTGGAGSPADFATQYVDRNFSAEAGNNQALHFFNIIANTLGSP